VSDREEIMPSDIDDDPPISHAIANGWAEFAEIVLPSIAGSERGKANVAFYFGAMHVLQILEHVVARESAEAAAIALGMLSTELDEFKKAHEVAIQ
jgi:hypothetical protein